MMRRVSVSYMFCALIVALASGCVASGGEMDEKKEQTVAEVDERPRPVRRGAETYQDVKGDIHDGFYTSPDRYFSIREPMLNEPRQLVHDDYDGGLNVWKVRFSDYEGRVYSVTWGEPKGFELPPASEGINQEAASQMVSDYFLGLDQERGKVEDLETYYDATLADGGMIAMYQWDGGSVILREYDVPHPDRKGESYKQYDKLDRLYIAFSTVHGGKVLRLEIDDRANMFEKDHANLGNQPNKWTPERRKILISEMESWAKTLKYGNVIPASNE